MKKLFISGVPLLESVSLWEPPVQELREKLGNTLCQATVPLQAYAREYECYLELHNSDVNTFLEYIIHFLILFYCFIQQGSMP